LQSTVIGGYTFDDSELLLIDFGRNSPYDF
jgi:hypothetical protein